MDVLGLAHNDTIAELTEQLYARLRVMRSAAGSEPQRARQALLEHRRIPGAIEIGDEEQAVQSIRQHIARDLERMLVRTTAARG